MWIHILIFMVILGVFLAGKMGRLPPEAGNPEEKKLFIRIALTGNIIGMLLTFQSGGDKVYSSGYRMEKEETGAYEEKFKVSVDGEEAGSLYVQVPEKETEVKFSPWNIAAGNSSICAWKSSFPSKPVPINTFAPIGVTDVGITRSPVIAAHL